MNPDHRHALVVSILTRVPLGTEADPELGLNTLIAQNTTFRRLQQEQQDPHGILPLLDSRNEFLAFCRDTLGLQQRGEILDAFRRGAAEKTKVIAWLEGDVLVSDELDAVKQGYPDLNDQAEESQSRGKQVGNTMRQGLLAKAQGLHDIARQLRDELPPEEPRGE